MTNVPEFYSTFNKIFPEIFLKEVDRMISTANRRFGVYERNNTKLNKKLNVTFEDCAKESAMKTLTIMGLEHYPGYCDNVSDISREWDSGILQLDAKTCIEYDPDFKVDADGNFKVHCGVAQTSLIGKSKTNKKVTGLQLSIIEGKPVYTMLVFLKWTYENGYKLVSSGIGYIPHIQDNVIVGGGKSSHEMRLRLKKGFWNLF